MCVKGTGGNFPCTPCMVEREDSCSACGADAPSRDVDETVRAQLKNSTMGSFRGAAARRAEVELKHSLNSVVPAMTAWAGLGNGPRMLYRFPRFDRLHVSDVEGGGSASGMIEVGHAWSVLTPTLSSTQSVSHHERPVTCSWYGSGNPFHALMVLVLWSVCVCDHDQVMDTGINRKMSNEVPF